MIETWQYVTLGAVIAIFIAIGRYKERQASARDDAFFATLEVTVANALAAQEFVLTSKEYLAKSFGHRRWNFECPPRTIRIFWDGRDREFGVELRDDESTTPVRKRIRVSGPWPSDPPERYQRVLDDVLDALDVAVQRDA